VGSTGTYVYTTDGGATWNMGNVGYFGNLNDVYFKDVNNGWIIGAEGTILETTDGGLTWQEVPKVTDNDLYTISEAGGTLWAVGKWGIILKKTLE
jgi:photosystem II stability/assembly factor-like uncharacterized protein